mgnify:CR=1 FL=1
MIRETRFPAKGLSKGPYATTLGVLSPPSTLEGGGEEDGEVGDVEGEKEGGEEEEEEEEEVAVAVADEDAAVGVVLGGVGEEEALGDLGGDLEALWSASSAQASWRSLQENTASRR